jgi:hypothetical protein
MDAKTRKALQRAAYNQGYHDAINARAPSTIFSADHPFHFYYSCGHDEGWPKRLVDTFILTAHGPVRERCTLERAAYLSDTLNFRMPGGRR